MQKFENQLFLQTEYTKSTFNEIKKYIPCYCRQWIHSKVFSTQVKIFCTNFFIYLVFSNGRSLNCIILTDFFCFSFSNDFRNLFTQASVCSLTLYLSCIL